MKKAIDISQYQGVIDWDAVKKDGVEFVIMRGGLGDDLSSQDDRQFERNWAECQRVGIPCTMYLFSYAAAKNGDISSELAHIRRLMNGKVMNCKAPIYIDVENTSGLNWRSISNEQMLDIFKRYKAGLNEMGFEMGIYSSRSAFWNEKMTDPWYAENVSIWVAEYAAKVNNFNRPYDLWQYSSSGSVPGINGRVDMDYLYADFALTQKTETNTISLPVNVTYQVYADGRWLPDVKNREDYAGIIGKQASGLYASADQGDLIYKVGLAGGGWLPEVKNREDFAGILGKPFDRVMVRSSAGQTIHVQAHTVGGAWLPAVTGYDENDINNGYAGIPGKAIDGLYIWSDPIVLHTEPEAPVEPPTPEPEPQAAPEPESQPEPVAQMEPECTEAFNNDKCDSACENLQSEKIKQKPISEDTEKENAVESKITAFLKVLWKLLCRLFGKEKE